MNRSRALGVHTFLVAASFFFVFPAFASAAVTDIAARTAQLLPTGGSSCAAITVTSVTPYIYEGRLDSFDVILPDTSYIAIGGSNDGSVVPFQHMTRRITPDGKLRIHVDLDPVLLSGKTPVSLTVLSSKTGVLCAATISFVVDEVQPMQQNPNPTLQPGSNGAHTPPKPSTSGTTLNGGVAATTAPATTTPASFLGMCAVQSGALKLWLVLLVLYVGIVAFAAFAQAIPATRSPAVPVALILAPLILLVGFWYFSAQCRAATWIPIALLVIAIAGLLAAFREKEASTLLLPGMQRPPMPMPPATRSSQVPTITTPTQKPSVTPDVKQTPTNPHLENIQKQFEEAKQNKDKQPSA